MLLAVIQGGVLDHQAVLPRLDARAQRAEAHPTDGAICNDHVADEARLIESPGHPAVECSHAAERRRITHPGDARERPHIEAGGLEGEIQPACPGGFAMRRHAPLRQIHAQVGQMDALARQRRLTRCCADRERKPGGSRIAQGEADAAALLVGEVELGLKPGETKLLHLATLQGDLTGEARLPQSPRDPRAQAPSAGDSLLTESARQFPGIHPRG